MKTKREEEESKLHRFGEQFITSLQPVRDKILRKEKKVDENKIFDFNWKEGQKVKQAKKDKKKGTYARLGMVFANPQNKYRRIDDIY